MKKCIVLLSGGLDSRLAVKIMQEKLAPNQVGPGEGVPSVKGDVNTEGKVIAVFFKLPFSKDNEKEVRDFLKEQKVKLEVLDCTKGKLLKDYLKVIKNPKYGRGAGVNPCIDCKIFMFNKAKEFADTLNGTSKNKIEFIATGEVEGQRPMSQMKKSLKLIEEKSGLGKRLLRPLSELNISGRRRDKQMALAKKFNISYPSPAGGCALCEKELKNRFKFLLERGINDKEIKLVNVGRHFVIDNHWVVLGKDENENKILENFEAGKIIVPDFPAPTALMLDKYDKEVIAPKDVPSHCVPGTRISHRQDSRYKTSGEVPFVDEDINTKGNKVNKLIEAYSKKGSLKMRKKFEKYKL